MKTIEVVAAAIIENGRLFAAARTDEKLYGKWEFPGGKIEVGEDAASALHRELKEELGIEVRILGVIGEIEHTYETFKVHMICFLCERSSGEMRLNVHKNARWLSSAELFTVDWLEADLPLVKAAQQFFKGGRKHGGRD